MLVGAAVTQADPMRVRREWLPSGDTMQFERVARIASGVPVGHTWLPSSLSRQREAKAAGAERPELRIKTTERGTERCHL